MKPAPYALLLGGNHPDALLELHDLKFTMASSKSEAFRNVAKLWFGDLKTAHVDAWMELSSVDGYNFTSDPQQASGNMLYFVNIGFYRPKVFNEDHQYFFLIGDSMKAVKKRAKSLIKGEHSLAHVDQAKAIDAIIPVEKIGQTRLYWKPSQKRVPAKINTGYWPLQSLI